MPLPVEKITKLQEDWTDAWHSVPGQKESGEPWAAIEANHHFNFSLWHEEDVARRMDVPDGRIVKAKRAIDGFNQQRNNAMERIDDWVLSWLTAEGIDGGEGRQHSETPGMIIDRLSILALKHYHMQEQTERKDASPEHIEKCTARLKVIAEQRKDLATALADLLDDLAAGRKRFKVYRQFKMYNDPTLNPQLYTQGGRGVSS